MSRSDPLISEQLGDYKIISVLGKGGMARVYRGFDPKLERFAAVKVIDKGLAQPEYRERFQREARAIAKLQHPRIVHVFQFGETEEYFYMAMVFVEGRDLAHLIREARALEQLLPVPRAMRIIRDVAEALDYAHAQGVIHRDVKPSNVMVTPEGRAVLTDFGLALSVTEGTIGSTFGTAHYIAPEQAVSSANAVPQSDQYSLGVVSYQMLTGRVPFDDPGITNIVLKHLNQTPATPSSVNPKLPIVFDAALMRALEKTPEARYSTCMGLVRALEDALDQVEREQAEAAFLDDWDAPQPVPRGQRADTAIDRPTTLAMPSTAEADVPFGVFDLDASDVLPMDDTPLGTPIPPRTPPSGPAQPPKRSTGEVRRQSDVRTTGEMRASRKTGEAPAVDPPSTASAMRRTTGAFARVTPPAEDSPRAASLPRRPAAPEPAPERRRSPVLYIGIAVGMIALLLVGGIILSGALGGGDLNTTPTSVVALGDTSATPNESSLTRPPTFTPTPSAAADANATREGAVIDSTAGVTADPALTTDAGIAPADPTATRTRRPRTPTEDAAAVGDDPSETPMATVSDTAIRTSAPTATPTLPRATAADTPTDAAPTHTETPTDRPIPTVTNRANETPTTRPPNTPRNASSDAPTRAPTTLITIVANRPTAADNDGVVLVYDGNTFALYNRTGAGVDISRWVFVQVDALIAGEAISYQASQWAGTGARLTNVSTVECLQLWRITLGNQPAPNDCPERAAWRSVGQRRWFWIRDDAGTFEIRDGQGFTARVLATCPTARAGDALQVTCSVMTASP
jgi:serine/threonine protein kinase